MGMMPKHGPWMSRRHHFHKRRFFPFIGGPFPFYPYTQYIIPRQIAAPPKIWYYAADKDQGPPDVYPPAEWWVEILTYDPKNRPVFGLLYQDYQPRAKVNIVNYGSDKEGNVQVLAQRVT